MRALVLNLDRETTRLAVQKAQLAHFNMEWERIAAITPETLSRKSDDPYWASWQRPLRDTEKAVLESHQKAWERVIEIGSPCLILEDDALLTQGLTALLDSVKSHPKIDHLTLETRGRKKLLGRKLKGLAIRHIYQDRTGAAAYLLWPSGAEKLLVHTAHCAALADAAICSAYTLKSYQAVPACAIQMDRCELYGLIAPIEVKSTIDVQRKPHLRDGFSQRQRIAFRSRRIWAQIRMGLRQLRFITKADLEMVDPSADWPKLKF